MTSRYFFFQAEDGIRDPEMSRGLGDVYKRQVQCSAVQCSAVQCSAVQCSAVQCSAMQCSAVQCSAVQCSGAKTPNEQQLESIPGVPWSVV